jgi:N-acetylornithine carbamoyltransferase
VLTRSLVGTDEWPDREILALLDEADRIKRGDGVSPALPGKVLAMVFLDPSLRTRTSFEVAMAREGGHAVVLEPGRGSWPLETRDGVVMDGETVEHLREAARVLGRYADALAVRAFPRGSSWAEAREDAVLRGFVAHAGVPVINLESARRHPCQGLADAMTLRERLGTTRGKRFVLAWTWHPKPLPTAVPVSAALAAARLGMEVVVARPPGFDLDPEDVRAIAETALRNGGKVRVEENLGRAVEEADAVYAKSWGRLDLFGDPEGEKRARAGLRGWIADAELMERTRGGRGFLLHCLPVRRGVEATDEVLDGPFSAVVDQAENRLHVQRALLRRLLGGTR